MCVPFDCTIHGIKRRGAYLIELVICIHHHLSQIQFSVVYALSRNTPILHTSLRPVGNELRAIELASANSFLCKQGFCSN